MCTLGISNNTSNTIASIWTNISLAEQLRRFVNPIPFRCSNLLISYECLSCFSTSRHRLEYSPLESALFKLKVCFLTNTVIIYNKHVQNISITNSKLIKTIFFNIFNIYIYFIYLCICVFFFSLIFNIFCSFCLFVF